MGGDNRERRGKSRERIARDSISAEVFCGGGIVAIALDHALGHLGDGWEGKDIVEIVAFGEERALLAHGVDPLLAEVFLNEGIFIDGVGGLFRVEHGADAEDVFEV